jgi:hypothetical protein
MTRQSAHPGGKPGAVPPTYRASRTQLTHPPTTASAVTSAGGGGGLPLPPFDSHGNIETGVLVAGAPQNPIAYTTLLDMRQQLVTDFSASTRRPAIWDGWMRHRTEIETFNIPYTTLVNGSFATNKVNPGDIDLCYLFESSDLNSIAVPDRARFDTLFDVAACKAAYSCDPYLITCYPMVHPRFQKMIRDIAYFTRAFGTDRRGRLKCILMVGDRGVI